MGNTRSLVGYVNEFCRYRRNLDAKVQVLMTQHRRWIVNNVNANASETITYFLYTSAAIQGVCECEVYVSPIEPRMSMRATRTQFCWKIDDLLLSFCLRFPLDFSSFFSLELIFLLCFTIGEWWFFAAIMINTVLWVWMFEWKYNRQCKISHL